MELPALDYRATMPGAIRHAAEEFGQREFIVMPDRRMTYAQAEQASRRLAKELLAAGAGKGTRIGAMYPYGTDWVVTWFAVTRIGAIYIPFSTSYKPAELRKSLRHGDVDTLLVPADLLGADQQAFVEAAVPGLAEHSGGPLYLADVPFLRSIWVSGGATRPWARPFDVPVPGRTGDAGGGGTDGEPLSDELLEAVEAEVSPADLMLIVYTSGTTSEPKGVAHTHGNFVRHGANLARFLQVRPEDRSLCAMPFFWIGGVGLALNTTLAVGSTILCVERFDPEAVLDLMASEGATSVTMWSQLRQRFMQYVAACGRDLTGIPAFAPPPPGTPTTTDPELRHNSLGMTETVGPHSGPGPEASRVLPEELRGSFGLLVPHVEHRIADPATNAALGEGEIGEVCIRGYSVMHGLYKRERHESFDDDGWFHTGDKGYLRDGYLFFEGRLSEMIKTSGSNVAPREVEILLETFDDVGLAVVLGIPDAARGEVVGAVLVPTEGATLDAAKVIAQASEELSSYKVPRRVLVLRGDEVPSLASGKPDKIRLRTMLAERGEPAS